MNRLNGRGGSGGEREWGGKGVEGKGGGEKGEKREKGVEWRGRKKREMGGKEGEEGKGEEGLRRVVEGGQLSSYLPLVGIDYVPSSLGLTLYPNETRSCVDIVITDDQIVEETEHFELTLRSDVVSFMRQSTVVVIEDNDCKYSHFIHTCYVCYIILCTIAGN
jgi:hypothetical protein